MFIVKTITACALLFGPILVMALADARHDLRRHFANRAERGRG